MRGYLLVTAVLYVGYMVTCFSLVAESLYTGMDKDVRNRLLLAPLLIPLWPLIIVCAIVWVVVQIIKGV